MEVVKEAIVIVESNSWIITVTLSLVLFNWIRFILRIFSIEGIIPSVSLNDVAHKVSLNCVPYRKCKKCGAWNKETKMCDLSEESRELYCPAVFEEKYKLKE